MLVTFISQSHRITMFGDVAVQILKMMGHSATVPGALLAADVPQALEQLNAAIALEKQKAKQIELDEDDENEDEYVEPPVSIVNRALPLIELLNTAVRDESNVMWEEE